MTVGRFQSTGGLLLSAAKKYPAVIKLSWFSYIILPMEDRSQSKQEDIATQQYRGASPVVAGLGEGMLQTKFLTLAGLVAGATAALIFPKQAAEAVGNLQKLVDRGKESLNPVKKAGAKIFDLGLDLGRHLADLVKSPNFVKTRLEKNPTKTEAVFNSAIMASAGLSLIGFITGLFMGGRASYRGKRQFNAAKEEILSERKTSGLLREKLIETQAELDDFKTADAAKHGQLKVAPDDTPHVQPDPHASPATHIQLSELAHEAPRAPLSDIRLN